MYEFFQRKMNLEKMKYKNDKLSYAFVLLGLLANVFYFVTFYRINDNNLYAWKIGITVIYNLLFLLIVFLCAEGVKTYKRGFSIILLIVTLGQIVRILILDSFTLSYTVNDVAMVVNVDAAMGDGTHTMLIVYLAVSALLLLVSAVTSFIKTSVLNEFIKRSKPVEEVEHV